MTPGTPHVVGVYETVMYTDDPVGTARFYTDVLRLPPLDEPDERGAVFRLPDGGMLLLFAPALSSRPGRDVPSHGAEGAGHVAFSVHPGTLDELAGALGEQGIEIEREIDWGRGRSLYFRDPAGNSVELVDGDIWPTPEVRV